MKVSIIIVQTFDIIELIPIIMLTFHITIVKYYYKAKFLIIIVASVL